MLLLWDKRGRYEMPDAGCQNSEISAVVPPGWEFLWGALEGLEVPLGGSRGPGSASGGTIRGGWRVVGASPGYPPKKRVRIIRVLRINSVLHRMGRLRSPYDPSLIIMC